MNYQRSRYRLFSGLAVVALIFAGCAPPIHHIQKLAGICPGKRTADESLSLLRSRAENTVPLKANGQCFLRYYNEENKLKKENFPVQIWVNPPYEIYVQGDVAFDPKGVTLGSNKYEFWLAMKPKKINSYWWGEWSEKSRPETLMVNPKLILEALGAVVSEDIKSWSLSNEGAYDILTKKQGGIKTKRIYISTCDYLIGRIEYFDSDGQVIIAMELDEYKELIDGFFVPGYIQIISYHHGAEKVLVQITAGSLKTTSFTDKQKWRLFARPQPKGFKHIYKIIGGNIIEYPQ